MNRDSSLQALVAGATDDLARTHSPAAIQHIAERLAHESYEYGRHQALIELRTTEQLMMELGLSRARIQQLARARNLGWKISERVRVFTPADIEAMRIRRPGRPTGSEARPGRATRSP